MQTLKQALYLTADGEITTADVFWKTPFNHDTVAEAKRVALICNDPSLAQQNGKEEADINTIVDRFLKTNTVPQIPLPPSYENFEDIFDFQSAMNAIKNATDSFLALPANVRTQFNNDPHKFVAYVDHCLETGDLEPLEKMNLALPKKPQEPPKATPEAKPPEPPKGDHGPPKT